MTEIAPVGTIGRSPSGRRCSDEASEALRLKQGLPVRCWSCGSRNEDGVVPWDGRHDGRARSPRRLRRVGYYRPEDGDDRFTDDGWFRTGDIATIDPMGYLEIRDRSKDLIKSGGEWISSVALEGALMGHPGGGGGRGGRGAAPQWLERPLAAVVLRAGMAATAVELGRTWPGDSPTGGCPTTWCS